MKWLCCFFSWLTSTTGFRNECFGLEFIQCLWKFTKCSLENFVWDSIQFSRELDSSHPTISVPNFRGPDYKPTYAICPCRDTAYHFLTYHFTYIYICWRKSISITSKKYVSTLEVSHPKLEFLSFFCCWHHQLGKIYKSIFLHEKKFKATINATNYTVQWILGFFFWKLTTPWHERTTLK